MTTEIAGRGSVMLTWPVLAPRGTWTGGSAGVTVQRVDSRQDASEIAGRSLPRGPSCTRLDEGHTRPEPLEDRSQGVDPDSIRQLAGIITLVE
jgi:hypothetical protein